MTSDRSRSIRIFTGARDWTIRLTGNCFSTSLRISASVSIRQLTCKHVPLFKGRNGLFVQSKLSTKFFFHGPSFICILLVWLAKLVMKNVFLVSIYDLVYTIPGEKNQEKKIKKSVTFLTVLASYMPEVMMRQKNRIIFRLTVTPANAGGREKEYKIYDGEPSFFNLSRKERKVFVENEISRVKDFLDREYRHPRELRA